MYINLSTYATFWYIKLQLGTFSYILLYIMYASKVQKICATFYVPKILHIGTICNTFSTCNYNVIT